MMSSMNNLCPVAPSSAVMKVCEQVVLCKLNILVTDFIYPIQFSYRDRILMRLFYVLENVYSHSEETK